MMPRTPVRSGAPRARRQRGAAMVEVLVSLLIVTFGILGMFGMQTQATVSQMESYQRAQALVLVKDMAQRLQANPVQAAAYVGQGFGTGTTANNCSSLTQTAARDLCEWSGLLQGAAELDGSSKVGAVIGAQGCITQPDPVSQPNLYLVEVAWQGLRETGPTPLTCGQGTYSSEDLRRGASLAVRLPVLS